MTQFSEFPWEFMIIFASLLDPLCSLIRSFYQEADSWQAAFGTILALFQLGIGIGDLPLSNSPFVCSPFQACPLCI